jgi:hypothetical protein
MLLAEESPDLSHLIPQDVKPLWRLNSASLYFELSSECHLNADEWAVAQVYGVDEHIPSFLSRTTRGGVGKRQRCVEPMLVVEG